MSAALYIAGSIVLGGLIAVAAALLEENGFTRDGAYTVLLLGLLCAVVLAPGWRARSD